MAAAIPARAVVCLGLTQLVSWGISFYLISNFGPAMQGELGWSGAQIYAGFSLAIVVMAFASPAAGRAIDRWGGQRVMPAGAVLLAIGCALLAAAHAPIPYYAAWIVLGLGMRLTLYDAAFATLARIGGPQARRAMSQITLFGGLASTVMWPTGQLLAQWLGWRGAVLAYAGFALLTLPLYLTLPRARYASGAHQAAHRPGLARTPADQKLAQGLYALIAMLTNFLAAANATHLIAMLTGLGLAASAAVGISALWGIGQVGARLLELLFGARLHPLTLNLATTVAMPLCFLAGALAEYPVAAALYAGLYGACNGLLTITRGTLPLALFDYRVYGALVGRLLVPGFLLTAVAPVAYAELIDWQGPRAAMLTSMCLAAVILWASAWLYWRFRPAAPGRADAIASPATGPSEDGP
ncbi:MFS transporter [Bordetella petrii]|uniref:MFS transporter n=1 Tax=Bordetella petrii TaxID=94624 RepID=UPI0004B28D3D|nr:MFS transporter [Bordetella petrii]